MSYSFVVSDSSSLDAGFVRSEDLAEYRQGSQVSVWGYQTNTQGTTQSVSLAAGSYDFILHCRNSFADCDLNYSLSGFY